MATGIMKHTFMREDMALVNPLEYGPASQTTLQAAMTDHAGESCTLWLTSGIWDLTTSMDFPENFGLLFSADAYLRPAVGVEIGLNQSPTSFGGLAGRRYWYADEVTTGRIRFRQIVGPGVLPEWWGVDGNGVVMSNAFWPAIFRAATTGLIHPVLLNGMYAVDGSTQPAIRLMNDVQLRGNMRRSNVIANDPFLIHSGKIMYHGTGDCIGTLTQASGYRNIVLENIYVHDYLQTADHGMNLVLMTGTNIRNVFIQGFDHAVYVQTGWYYGNIEQLKCLGYRKTGFIVSDNLNGVDVDLHLNSRVVTAETHFAIGIQENGASGGQCNDNRVFALIEPSGGTPCRLTRCRGGDYNIYMETPGQSLGQFAAQAISVEMCNGVELKVFCQFHESVATGVRVFNTEGASASYQATSRTKISGIVQSATTTGLLVDTGPVYGIDTTGFITQDMPNAITSPGIGNVGVMYGDRYISTGHKAPGADQGRGSTMFNRQWKTGDLIESTVIGPGLVTRFRCTAGGNPGDWRSEGLQSGAQPLLNTNNPNVLGINNNYYAFNNTGCTAQLVVTLPPSSNEPFGRYRFTRTANFDFRIYPASGGSNDVIRFTGGPGKCAVLGALGANIELELMGNVWEVVAQSGTVTFEP